MTGSRSVLVDIRKYDGSVSGRWTATRLGEDEHGVWLGTPRGVPVTATKGGWANRFDHVLLVPRGEWWIATFCAAPGPEMYCDVCTVPEWDAGATVLSAIDLDLDVVRSHGGEAYAKDEEEFAEHRVSYGYPGSVVEGAQRACAWLMEAGHRDGAGAEPFTSAYRRWLGLMTGDAGHR